MYTRQTISRAQPGHSPVTLMLLGVGLLLALCLAWLGRVILLLLFAAIVVAVLLDTIVDWLQAKLNLSRRLAFALLLFTAVACIALGLWLIGPRIVDQFADLQNDLPLAAHNLLQKLDGYRWGHWALTQWPSYSQLSGNLTYALTRIGGMVVSTASVLAGIMVVTFLSLYLAAEPEVYLSGIRRATPRAYRHTLSACITGAAHLLRWWLLSQMLSMAAVGTIVWIGLLTIGVPLAGTLGMIAAAFTFIPNIGPVLSVVPAALLAVAISPMKGLLVIALYMLVHFLEGNLINPLLGRKLVRLPPVLTMTAQLLLAVIAGPLGLTLAAPLTAAALGIFQVLLPSDQPETSLPLATKPFPESSLP